MTGRYRDSLEIDLAALAATAGQLTPFLAEAVINKLNAFVVGNPTSRIVRVEGDTDNIEDWLGAMPLEDHGIETPARCDFGHYGWSGACPDCG